MQITWLDADRTQAIVTRGFLWWRRRTAVHRSETNHSTKDSPQFSWFFNVDNIEADYSIRKRLDDGRRWRAVASLPVAIAIAGMQEIEGKAKGSKR
jgi:hypothetical protein